MKIKFILILILLLLLFNNIESYIIKDVRVTNTLPVAYSYSNSQCEFTYNFYCATTNENEQCKTLTYSIPPSITPVILKENDTSSIISASWDIAIGTTTITVNLIYTFNITCLAISVDDIKSFKLYSKNGFIVPNTQKKIMSYGAVYELEGLDSSNGIPAILNANCVDIPDCEFTYYGGINKYLLLVSKLDNTVDYSSNITININIQSITKSFTFNSIFKEIYDQVYDIKTYPNQEYLSGLYLLGINETPVISFKSNNTMFKASYIINQNNSTSSNQIIPIYGDENSTTYLYSMSNLDVNTQYDIYYQSGFNYLKSNQLINALVHKVKFISLESTGIYSSVQNYLDFDRFVEFKYIDGKQYTVPPIQITSNGVSIITDFPFGFIKVMKIGYEFSYCFPLKDISSTANQLKVVSAFDDSGSTTIIPAQSYVISKLPSITNIKEYHLKDNLYLYRVSVNTPYEFSNIVVYDGTQFGYESIISGNSLEGVYEVVQSSSFDVTFTVYDIYRGLATAGTNTIISLSPEPQVFLRPQFSYFDVFSIQNVSFLYNDLDITNHRHYNVMYFNYSDQVPRDKVFSMVHSGALTFNPLDSFNSVKSFDLFHSTYDQDIQLFKIEFYVDANIEYGVYSFNLYVNTITISSELFNTQLRIKKTNTDLQGPIFKNITKVLPSLIDSTNNIGVIGWNVIIEDSINGFDFGYITVKGVWPDTSIYNISINSNHVKYGGNVYLGEYDILFKVEYPCFSSSYYIAEVLLVDKAGRRSFFTMLPPNKNLNIGVVSPFLYYLNDTQIRLVNMTCLESEINSDTTAPLLNSFSSSTNSIDVGKTDRRVTFTFTAQDTESGLKNYQYPIVYLSSYQNKMLECKSSIVSINNINATYSCTIQLPLGYAYPNQIILSVYGFINNNGLSSGYNTNDLSKFATANIFTKYDQSIIEPSITSHYLITENGGELLLFGKGFGSDSTAYITFYDGSTSIIKASTIYPTAIKIQNVKPTAKEYQLYIKTNSFNSNNLTIIPTVYDYYINIGPLNPTTTPAPTNSPQSCPGNPICGGPSNGKCIENQGCVCYSPWIGLDCLSQIIIIDQPTANDTSPSTNITLPVNNNNSSTIVTYKSLITLVSIRELNILGSVVYNKSFDKWQVRKLDPTTFIYNTTLSINKNNQISTTEFTVTLKWFTNETTINFANEQLLMNPSTMKYTIEINNYPFDNNLNQLQLIMSASLQSNSSDNICSLREYGETTSGDNSNYLKIQVDNHSLFGRFIRRGIIDSTITTITNVLLDKDMNSITTTKELQSYIAIQIPNYKRSVIVDPDFSIIIDSHSASSKSNSICSSKSKLTSGKIAGIVIGCAAFLAVIIITVSYHIIKKKKDARFVQNVNQKMKNMNNDKL